MTAMAVPMDDPARTQQGGFIMRSKRRMLTVSGLAIVAVAAITAGSQAAGSTLGGVAKPVIGPPVTVPKVPLAGKPMAVTFKVTRQDTGTPLTSGKMICDPSVEGKVIAHAESFRAGTARMAFTVPTTAAGKMLRVKVRIVSGTQAATKVSTFKVQAAAKPVVSIGDASVAEGNAGTTAMSFPVTLSTPAAGTVTVAYATSDGTATTPGDYGSASGTLTFNAGEKTKAVAVNVVGDLAIEPDETFTVTLSNAVNASLGKATATGRITNDDTAVPVTRRRVQRRDPERELRVLHGDAQPDGHPVPRQRPARDVLAVWADHRRLELREQHVHDPCRRLVQRCWQLVWV